MITAKRFTRAAQSATVEAERFLPALEKAYRQALRAAGRNAATAFTGRATPLEALTAAANTPPEGEPLKPPRFIAPDIDEVVSGVDMAQDVAARTRRTRQKAAEATAEGILTRLGISFDVGGVFSETLMLGAGARAADMDASIRDSVVRAITDGLNDGLSVPDTAALIREQVNDIAGYTATALARTDLVGISNGSSVAAARQVYPEGGVLKTWLSSDDERTRETHSDADGQTVPIDQPFEVGGDALDYPGDPSGSDEETINCRCTVIYEEVATVADVPAAEPELVTAAVAPVERVGELARIGAEMEAAVRDGHHASTAWLLERERVSMLSAIEALASRPVRVELGEFAPAAQAAPNITVNVPEQAPPSVTVMVPEQPPPVVQVDVAAPAVTVEAPSVTVEAAVIPAPEVNVTVEQPVPQRSVSFQRDSRGRIVSAEIEED